MSVRSACLAITLLASAGLPAQYADAQAAGAGSMSSVAQSSAFETREQLESQARAAEARGRTGEAWLLRSRLQRGDFQEGDRVVLVLDGSPMIMDTMQVRSGNVLQFPRMGELSLVGVLRAELTEALRRHLARYLTAPVVRATPLFPILVHGNVNAPGFYYSPADVVLRDLLMRAGGPVGDADLDKIVVRRNAEVIWKPSDVRVALSDGLSLDDLHMRAGDELFVPRRRQFNTNTIIALASSGIALLVAVSQLSR